MLRRFLDRTCEICDQNEAILLIGQVGGSWKRTGLTNEHTNYDEMKNVGLTRASASAGLTRSVCFESGSTAWSAPLPRHCQRLQFL